MSATGSCLCGRYRFAVVGNPRFVAHCHCSSCRRALGAPVAPYVGFAASAVRFNDQAGTAAVPSYASSPGVRRGFCDQCGTALYYAAENYPDETHLLRSNFAHPEAFEPTGHVFFEEHEGDLDLYDDLPRYARGSNEPPAAWGAKPALRILYLCTGNSARSLLAEAITNLRGAAVGERRVRAHSAGSQPAGQVNAGALELIKGDRHRLGVLRSKSWDEFTTPAAPPMDLVITLCDSAAAETCPAFPGAAEKRHWGLPDPASGAISFDEVYGKIEALVEGLLGELGARVP